MSYAGILDPAELIDIYKRLILMRGQASCADVADELRRRGHKSPTTGRPFTRQAVWYRLNQSEEGRALLLGTKKRMGRAHDTTTEHTEQGGTEGTG